MKKLEVDDCLVCGISQEKFIHYKKSLCGVIVRRSTCCVCGVISDKSPTSAEQDDYQETEIVRKESYLAYSSEVGE